jgi:hypothetical protein
MGEVGFQPEDAFQANISFNYKRSPSIDDLIARVRANEDYIFSHARERALDPLALRSRLLLRLPRLVTADALPGHRDIQEEMLVV